MCCDVSAPQPERKPRTFALFGNFGLGNFGNDSTLRAFLYHLRLLVPDVELNCICTGPAATASNNNLTAVSMCPTFLEFWMPRNRAARALRSFFVGVPSELYRWVKAFRTLKHTDVFIVPGTGLLTDAYGLRTWGPYGLLKWSLIAKIRG